MIERQITVTPLGMVKPRRARFAWEGRVPIGAPTIFAGTGGIGKSTILAWLTAQLTKGTLPGDLYGKPVTVALIAGEDDLDSVLVPRLMAAGADLDRVWSVKVNAIDGDDTWSDHPMIANDLLELRKQLHELGVSVLIVDPVVSMQSGNTNNLADVRRDLNRLVALATELDLAMIWVHHFNKGQGSASDRLSGSHAYRDTVRSALSLAEDDNSDQRILSHEKSNYGPLKPSLAFTIEDATLDIEGEICPVGCAIFQGETDVDVSDILNGDPRPLGETKTKILELAENGQTLTPERVASELDISRNSARAQLSKLKKMGHLESHTQGHFTKSGIPSVARFGVAPVALGVSNTETPQHRNSTGRSVTPLFGHCQNHLEHPTVDGVCALCLQQQQPAG
jgi:predicted ATP-dependent serine protease